MASLKIKKLISDFGFGRFLHELGLSSKPSKDTVEWPEASALSQLLLALGPGFVEAGRIVGSRSDLVPSQYQADLLYLRYYPPLPGQAGLERLLQRQLLVSPVKLLSHFDFTPFRRHALGSTHQAVLRDGRRALLTFNYPETVRVFQDNLKIAHWLIARVAATIDRRHRPIWESVGEELTARGRAMADLTQVAGRLEIFASQFSGADKFISPAALWPYITPAVLVQRVHNGTPLREARLAKSYAARYILESFVSQYGVLGQFLLRPRLEDFSVLPKNQILANNFLETGQLEPAHRGQFILLLWALLVDDFNLAGRVLLKAHYGAAQHHDAHRVGVVLTKASPGFKPQATFAEKLWHALEKGWQGHLSIPLSFTMAAESLLFLETMLARVYPEGDFGGNLLSAIKKYSPRIFGTAKNASLAQIAKTVIF